jgi:mannitol/fructose-specific phosphotransferase system IIA component (Ntr-type)
MNAALLMVRVPSHAPRHSSAHIFLPAKLNAFIIPPMKNPGPIVLSKLMSATSVNLNLKSTDREGVLEELVNQVAEISKQPDARQTLLKALHEREQLHSTGIGDGVALPHARNALVGLVDHPVIIFGRSAEGVNFGAIDGAPSKLFFLLVAPTVTEHLSMLARISRLLRDPRLRHELLVVDAPKKALALIRDAEAGL